MKRETPVRWLIRLQKNRKSQRVSGGGAVGRGGTHDGGGQRAAARSVAHRAVGPVLPVHAHCRVRTVVVLRARPVRAPARAPPSQCVRRHLGAGGCGAVFVVWCGVVVCCGVCRASRRRQPSGSIASVPSADFDAHDRNVSIYVFSPLFIRERV